MDVVNVSVTNQTCEVLTHSQANRVLYPFFYMLLFVFSILGNSTVLYVTSRKHCKKFNPTSLYLVHLALSDSLFLVALPGRIIYYARESDWPFGDLMCRLTALVFYTNTYASIGFMTCISMDRCLAMLHPSRLRFLRRSRSVQAVCGTVWMLVLLQNVPLLFKSLLGSSGARRTCMEFSSLDGSRSVAYLLLLACTVSFCFPLGIILVCYTRINLHLRAAAQRRPTIGQHKHQRRANHIILLVLLTFIICFSPYHLNLMQFVVRRLFRPPSCQQLKVFKTSLQITVSMMNLNCCLDPILYFFAIKTYKQRVMSIFKGFAHSSTPKTTPEICSSNS